MLSLEGCPTRLGLEGENDGSALHDGLGLKELPIMVSTFVIEERIAGLPWTGDIEKTEDLLRQLRTAKVTPVDRLALIPASPHLDLCVSLPLGAMVVTAGLDSVRDFLQNVSIIPRMELRNVQGTWNGDVESVVG